MSSQAIPILEAIAVNDNVCSLHRFERDDPPPYRSSTESAELDDEILNPPRFGRPMPDELKAIMERPIDDKEINGISFRLESIVIPTTSTSHKRNANGTGLKTGTAHGPRCLKS